MAQLGTVDSATDQPSPQVIQGPSHVDARLPAPGREIWMLDTVDLGTALWPPDATPSWYWGDFADESAHVEIATKITAQPEQAISYADSISTSSSWKQGGTSAFSLIASFGCGLVLMFASRKLRSRWI